MKRRIFLAGAVANSLLASCAPTRIDEQPAAPAAQTLPTATASLISEPTPVPTLAQATPTQVAQVRQGIEQGMQVIDAEMTLVEDNKVVKLSDFRGKAIYINFWATWCGPCRTEMPDIEKLYQKYKDNPDVAIIGLSIGEQREVVEKFLKNQQKPFNFIFALDERNRTARQFNITGIPSSFFIRPNGIISRVYPGPIPYVIMESSMNKTLATD